MSAQHRPSSAAPTASQGPKAPIRLLEDIRRAGKTWAELAPRWGVSEPDPPWKTSLHATCECLSAVPAPAAPRRAEDELGETLYCGTPAPEQQLLALAHT